MEIFLISSQNFQMKLLFALAIFAVVQYAVAFQRKSLQRSFIRKSGLKMQEKSTSNFLHNSDAWKKFISATIFSLVALNSDIPFNDIPLNYHQNVAYAAVGEGDLPVGAQAFSKLLTFQVSSKFHDTEQQLTKKHCKF